MVAIPGSSPAPVSAPAAVSDKLLLRRREFWDLFDFSTGRGLEIGPLHRAIVNRDEADVRYVDIMDRDSLVAHYRADGGVPVHLIPEIDYPLLRPDGTTESLANAVAGGAPFSWVMASHVIEHIPDVIGWLAEIAAVTEDSAALVLAVPDRRYCFDAVRPPTTVGQLVEAHLNGHSRPSPRAVYDYFGGVVDYDIAALWRGEVPGHDRRLYTQEHVEAKLEESLHTYVDAHVWLFTPRSFVEQLHELRVSGRSDWYVERLEPTAPEREEFRVVLRRVARGTPFDEVIDAELLPDRSQPEWIVAPDVSDLVPHLDATITELRDRLRDRRARLRAVRTRHREQLAAQQQTIDELRRELALRQVRRPRVRVAEVVRRLSQRHAAD